MPKQCTKVRDRGGRWFQAALEEPWEKRLALCCGKVLVLDLDLDLEKGGEERLNKCSQVMASGTRSGKSQQRKRGTAGKWCSSIT
jgi:hypothetical protein